MIKSFYNDVLPKFNKIAEFRGKIHKMSQDLAND